MTTFVLWIYVNVNLSDLWSEELSLILINSDIFAVNSGLIFNLFTCYCIADMGAKKDPKKDSKTPAKNPKKKEGGGGGKAKKKKWSKGKARDKLNNLVLFDKVIFYKNLKIVNTCSEYM